MIKGALQQNMKKLYRNIDQNKENKEEIRSRRFYLKTQNKVKIDLKNVKKY